MDSNYDLWRVAKHFDDPMKIFAVPDPADEVLDPVDPLGSLLIQNLQGDQLLERSVFIDDWFCALLSGLANIRAGNTEAHIDLNSVRDPLIWKALDTGALISHKGRSVVIQDLAAFEQALRRAVLDFTGLYTSHPNWSKCTELVAVREWALRR